MKKSSFGRKRIANITSARANIDMMTILIFVYTCQTHFTSVARIFIHSFQINPSDDSVFLQDWFIPVFLEIRYET